MSKPMKLHTLFWVVMASIGSAAAQDVTDYVPPRTSWGAPDLEGVWNNTSLTQMERPSNIDKLAVSAEEATFLARQHVYTRAAYQDGNESKVDAESSRRLLADKNTSRAYNSFWLDTGTGYATVKGEYRTSWITEPSDGRIPYRDLVAATRPRMQVFDGPEVRPQSERCLMSFTGGAGPVMSNGLYNNNYQIVQTPGYVMVLSEMIHDVRIIPIGGKHASREIPKWGGDSIGWYEGDTLIVETVNPNPRQRSYISATGKLTERFTRWSDGQIVYQFTVADPTLYAKTWSGEIALNASQQPLYEYACHEGNYALPSILSGARALDREGREQPPIKEAYPGVDVSEGQ
jgi:hypothetical protein